MAKQRGYNKFSGHRKDDNEIHGITDHNIQVNVLPDVGQYVVVNQLRVMSREYRDQTGIYSIYVYNDAYFDYFGNPIVYQVEGYTKGREYPFDPANNVILVNKSKNGKLVRRTQIKTAIIATGSMELELVDPEKIEQVGFRTYDGYNLLGEDVRIVEKYIAKGRYERVCRKETHI